MPDSSISQWIAALKKGDALAAQQLWERYAEKLVALARQRLGRAPRTASDEEDIALSAFRSVCRAAANGRFSSLKDREELWWLLLRVTRHKILDQVRHGRADRRGGGYVFPLTDVQAAIGDEVVNPLEELISQEPSAEYLAILAEENARLLGLLRDDRLREVALRRLEGFTIEEIATHLNVSVRTVHRKLRLIEEQWMEEVVG